MALREAEEVSDKDAAVHLRLSIATNYAVLGDIQSATAALACIELSTEQVRTALPRYIAQMYLRLNQADNASRFLLEGYGGVPALERAALEGHEAILRLMALSKVVTTDLPVIASDSVVALQRLRLAGLALPSDR
jgi:hypothetical protein